MTDTPNETVTYRLCRTEDPKVALWLAWTPSGQGDARAWEMQVTARGRGGAKTLAVLWETTPLCPLASVTVGGETYPLAIGWHEKKRGGLVCFGGQRKLGAGGALLHWEMRLRPDATREGAFVAEMRVQTAARKTGTLHLSLRVPLHRPQVWTLDAAAQNGHFASLVHSHWGGLAACFSTLEPEAGWDELSSAFCLSARRFPMGGSKRLRFFVYFLRAKTEAAARAPLTERYALLAGDVLHPLVSVPAFDPAPIAKQLTDPARYQAVGAQRVYLKPPSGEEDGMIYAGFPHYPLDAYKALWDWNRFHARENVPRLIRYGASGLAADFQVMGRDGQPEPNKGAFWDKKTGDAFTDFQGGAAHGIASCARLARGFFLLHEALGGKEPLQAQSALNICQWLILKRNHDGWYDGAHFHATRSLPDDGRALPPSPDASDALDGAEVIRPCVLAYRETKNEVFLKAAWKVADFLLEARLSSFEAPSPASVARVISNLAALDAEAPNARLRAALNAWGAWLLALPLLPDAPGMSDDGLHSGLYDCAEAGLHLFALTHDVRFLRYALAAWDKTPAVSRAQSWRELALAPRVLLAQAALLPDAVVDFDRLTVTLGWRAFSPDPATEKFVGVRAALDGSPVSFLPLVCRLTNQVLLLVLAPPDMETVEIGHNGRRPAARDLLSGALDAKPCLHAIAGERWGRAGLFILEP